jgi:hypothetical protein
LEKNNRDTIITQQYRAKHGIDNRLEQNILQSVERMKTLLVQPDAECEYD